MGKDLQQIRAFLIHCSQRSAKISCNVTEHKQATDKLLRSPCRSHTGLLVAISSRLTLGKLHLATLQTPVFCRPKQTPCIELKHANENPFQTVVGRAYFRRK